MIGLVPTVKAQSDLRRADFSKAEIEVYRYGDMAMNQMMQKTRKRSSFPNDSSDNSKDSIKEQIEKPSKDSGLSHFNNNPQVAAKTKRRGQKDTQEKQKEQQTIGNQLKKLKLIHLKSKVRKIDAACAFFGFLGVFLQTIELEIFFSNQSDNSASNLTASNQVLRIITSLSTLILLILNTYFYYKQYCYKRLRGFQISLGETFMRSREFKLMIFTNFINIFHCPPFLDKDILIKTTYHIYRLNYSIILSNIMILRFYLIIRLITNLSQWKNIHSEECCEREGFEANLQFAIKSLLKEKPFQMLAFNFLISILAFGFSVRSFERAYYEDQEYKDFNGDNVPYQNYNYVWNSFWLVVVTMTTVGFGDFYPVTDGGRLVIVISCFWGIFMVSQFVYTLQVRSEFTLAEQKAFELLRRLIQKQELKKEAAQLIIAWWRARKFRKLNQNKSLNKSDLIKYATIIGKRTSAPKSFINIVTFAQDVFVKRIGQFQKERQRIQKQGIPLSENLQKINKLIENHLKELNNAMMTFREMRKNIEKLTSEIERDNINIDNIQTNLQSLDYVLNKIVYLKSHAVNMMFKDAVVLKKEELDQATIYQGMGCLKQLMTSALSMIMKETQQKLFGLEWNQRDFMQKLNFNEMIKKEIQENETFTSIYHKQEGSLTLSTPKTNTYQNQQQHANNGVDLKSQHSDFQFVSPINPFNFNNSPTKIMFNNTPQLHGMMISPQENDSLARCTNEEQRKEIPSNHQQQQVQQQQVPPTPMLPIKSIHFESPYEIRTRENDETINNGMRLDDVQAIQAKIQNRKLQLIKNEIDDIKVKNIQNEPLQQKQQEEVKRQKIMDFLPVKPPENIHDQNDQWDNKQGLEIENNSGSRKKSSIEQGVFNDILKNINEKSRQNYQSIAKINSKVFNLTDQQYSRKETPITQIIQDALRMSIKLSSEGDEQMKSHQSSFTANKTDKQVDIFQTIDQAQKQLSQQQQLQFKSNLLLKNSTTLQQISNTQLVKRNDSLKDEEEEKKEAIMIKERLEKTGQWMTKNLPSFFDEAMLNMVKVNQQYSKKHSITKNEVVQRQQQQKLDQQIQH